VIGLGFWLGAHRAANTVRRRRPQEVERASASVAVHSHYPTFRIASPVAAIAMGPSAHNGCRGSVRIYKVSGTIDRCGIHSDGGCSRLRAGMVLGVLRCFWRPLVTGLCLPCVFGGSSCSSPLRTTLRDPRTTYECSEASMPRVLDHTRRKHVAMRRPELHEWR